MTYIWQNCICWSNNIKGNVVNVVYECTASLRLYISMNMYGDIFGLAAD